MPRVTRHEYWAALDALAKAQAIEAEKLAAGEAALTEWWKVAEPRWRELDILLDKAEREDWAASAVWFDLWREAKRRGMAPGSVDAKEREVLGPHGEKQRRQAATAPRTRSIQVAGLL